MTFFQQVDLKSACRLRDFFQRVFAYSKIWRMRKKFQPDNTVGDRENER